MKIFTRDFTDLIKEAFYSGSTTTGVAWGMFILGVIIGASIFG